MSRDLMHAAEIKDLVLCHSCLTCGNQESPA
jgi:hypothetical protein